MLYLDHLISMCTNFSGIPNHFHTLGPVESDIRSTSLLDCDPTSPALFAHLLGDTDTEFTANLLPQPCKY